MNKRKSNNPAGRPPTGNARTHVIRARVTPELYASLADLAVPPATISDVLRDAAECHVTRQADSGPKPPPA